MGCLVGEGVIGSERVPSRHNDNDGGPALHSGAAAAISPLVSSQGVEGETTKEGGNVSGVSSTPEGERARRGGDQDAWTLCPVRVP